MFDFISPFGYKKATLDSLQEHQALCKDTISVARFDNVLEEIPTKKREQKTTRDLSDLERGKVLARTDSIPQLSSN